MPVKQMIAGCFLLAPILKVHLLQRQLAIGTQIVFHGNLTIPVIQLFNRCKSPIVIPDYFQQLAEMVKVLQIDDAAIAIIATANVHDPRLAVIVVVADAICLAFPLWIQMQILKLDDPMRHQAGILKIVE